MSKLKKDDKLFLAGHSGMVGSAILRLLEKDDSNNIFTISRSLLDLKDSNNKIKLPYTENVTVSLDRESKNNLMENLKKLDFQINSKLAA